MLGDDGHKLIYNYGRIGVFYDIYIKRYKMLDDGHLPLERNIYRRMNWEIKAVRNLCDVCGNSVWWFGQTNWKPRFQKGNRV